MENKSDRHDSLRKNAEASLVHKPSTDITPQSAEKLLHELQVHQVELEMQNEELRRAQVIIEEMRDRYVDLYEFAPAGYFTLTRDSLITEVNVTGATMLGVERNKLLNRRLADFIIPGDSNHWHHHFMTVLQRDGRQHCELAIRRSDGLRIQVRATSLKAGDSLSSHEIDDLSNPNDTPNNSALLRIVLTDITEIKAVEKVLWEKNQLLDSIVENIPNMIFLKRASDLRFELFNKAGENLLGYSRSDLLGKGDYDFWPREQADRFTAEDRKVLASVNGTEIQEEPIKTGNGETRYLHTWKVALRDESGEPTHLLGISVDITEHKKTEETHDRLMAHLDASPDFVSFADATDAHLLYLNRAGRILTGVAEGEDVTQIKMPHLHPASTNKMMEEEAMPTAIRTGFWQGECAFLHRNGHEIPVSMVVVAHKSAGGAIEVFSTISRDITERKLAEKKLATSHGKLQQLALHLDNVREAERGRIARELHDEMGATLTALKMRVHWLASKLPADMAQLAAEAENIDKLLTDTIQTMHHVVSQLMPIHLHDLGFAAAVEGYVQNFRRQTEIKCNLTLPEKGLVLDENQSSALFRILQESLNNVAKHAQATNVNIQFTNKGNLLILEVNDNGIGFDMKSQKIRSFGLFGIRERALMVNGKAKIISMLGKGTKVLASIPLA